MIEMYPFVSKFKRGKFLYLALTKYKHIDLVYLAISADFFVGNVYYWSRELGTCHYLAEGEGGGGRGLPIF